MGGGGGRKMGDRHTERRGGGGRRGGEGMMGERWGKGAKQKRRVHVHSLSINLDT